MTRSLCFLSLFWPLTSIGRAETSEIWLAVERELLAEINFLRTEPERYVAEVLKPLTDTAKRVPRDESKEFEAFRVYLSNDRIDYIELNEGDTPDDALATLDEAIEAVTKSKPSTTLARNDVLDEAARFFSRDYMQATKRRPPHIDSLGREPATRIATFGTTKRLMADWQALQSRVADKGEVTVRVFEEGDSYFLVELPARGGYSYRYVARSCGEFVAKHGQVLTIPRVKKEGHEARLLIDVETRTLTKGDESIPYPIALPTHGENIVWGAWSRKLAARGLVCWWVIDPGIASRGHRKLLLDPDFKFCGIGVTWSHKTGWVATLDVAAEALMPFEK